VTDNTAPAVTGLDTAEAASLISDLITDDLQVGDQTAVPQAHQTDDDELRAERDGAGDKASKETRSKDDQVDDDKEGSEEDEEDEKPEQDEEDDEAKAKGSEVFTVKIDGKEVEVPKEEVIAGYQRQADYSRKTQALSEERNAFQAIRQEHETEKQQVAQERGQYKVLLTQLSDALKQLEPQEPNWQELYQTDKNEYLIARDNWRAFQEQKAAAAAELDRVSQTERGEHQKLLQNHIAEGRKKLVEWEPKWQDQKALRDDFAATVDYAKSKLGYTDAELANANDHRALFAVHKARLYDELMAKAKDVKQTAAPKKVLPAGSANRTVATQQTRSKQDGMKRLVRGGGRVEDAAGLLADMMDP
jgi:hypothetical protein